MMSFSDPSCRGRKCPNVHSAQSRMRDFCGYGVKNEKGYQTTLCFALRLIPQVRDVIWKKSNPRSKR